MSASRPELVEQMLGSSFTECSGISSNEVYADAGRTQVMRIGGLSLCHEASILPSVPDAVPHATVIDHGRIDSERNRAWIVNTYVPGRDARKVWNELALESRARFLDDAKDALNTVHTSVDPEANSVWGGQPTYRPSHFGEGQFDGLDSDNFRRRVDIVQKLGFWTEDRTRAILSRYDELRADSGLPYTTSGDRFVISEAADATHIHGDAHLGNFIVSPDDGSLRGLIDFEAAGRGLPQVDYYRTLGSIDRYDSSFLDSREGSSLIGAFLGGVDEQTLSTMSLLNLVYNVRQVRDMATTWRNTGVPAIIDKQIEAEAQGNGIRERIDAASNLDTI